MLCYTPVLDIHDAIFFAAVISAMVSNWWQKDFRTALFSSEDARKRIKKINTEATKILQNETKTLLPPIRAANCPLNFSSIQCFKRKDYVMNIKNFRV